MKSIHNKTPKVTPPKITKTIDRSNPSKTGLSVNLDNNPILYSKKTADN